MRSHIEHSGAVNDDPRFTFKLSEVRHSSITIDRDVSSLHVQISEAELRDMLVRGLLAIEEMRLRGQFDAGTITFEEYEAAINKIDHTRYTAVLQETER